MAFRLMAAVVVAQNSGCSLRRNRHTVAPKANTLDVTNPAKPVLLTAATPRKSAGADRANAFPANVGPNLADDGRTTFTTI